MTTAIIVIILILIGIVSVKSYVKKLSSGCCGAGGDQEKKIQPKDSDTSHYPYSVRVEIGGMHCQKCAERIENAFNKRDGFYAQADFKNGSAVVYAKKQPTNFELKSVISGLNYTIKSIEQLQQ